MKKFFLGALVAGFSLVAMDEPTITPEEMDAMMQQPDVQEALDRFLIVDTVPAAQPLINTFDAVKTLSPEQLEQFLYNNGEGRSDINAPETVLRLSPLHVAAHNRALMQAELLLKYGAQLGVIDHESNTPLHHAALQADTAMCGLLLDVATQRKQLQRVLSACNTSDLTPAMKAPEEQLKTMLNQNDCRACDSLITEFRRKKFERARGNQSTVEYLRNREIFGKPKPR